MSENMKKDPPEAINYYFSHTTFQSIFPKTDIHRRASSDSDKAFLSYNTRVGLQEVYERLYCSRKELCPFVSRAKRIAAVHQKVKYWHTQECHAQQVKQRIEEMERRRASVEYITHPMKTDDICEKKRAVSAPLTRTSSPIRKRADEIRRQWRSEVSTQAEEDRLQAFQKRLQRPCAVETYPSSKSLDNEMVENKHSEEEMRCGLRSGGDCQYQQRDPQKLTEKTKKITPCYKQPRILHPDLLYGESPRLDPITSASVHPDHLKLHPSGAPEVEDEDILHRYNAKQLLHSGLCPSPLDSMAFHEKGTHPQSSVVFPQLALPMSPIDIYCSLEGIETLRPPPLFHPATYRTELHQKYLDLYKDRLPDKNLEDHPSVIKTLVHHHIIFDNYFRHLHPFEESKQKFTLQEKKYPIAPGKYILQNK